jgi:hypothetical protein
MKQLILKYKVQILIALGVLTLIFLLIGKKSPPLPKVTSFSPINAAQKIDLRTVPTYQIDTPITLSDLTLTSTPNFNFQLSEATTGTILATHPTAFQPSTTYSLTLSWQNQNILTHSFTTIKSQEDPLLIQNMKDELARDYPLAQKLPLNTPQYRVVYSAPLTREITLKNPNLTSAEVIEEVKSWVTQNGGNANVHKYVISDQPLPSATPLKSSVYPLSSSAPSPTPIDWDNLQDDGT